MLLVGRHDRDDAVAGFDQGEVHKVVGSDRPMRDEDVADALPLIEGGDGRTEAVSALDRAVGELHREQLVKQAAVVPGEFQQLGDGKGVYAGLGKVEGAAGLVLVHPLLDTERCDLHDEVSRAARAARAMAASSMPRPTLRKNTGLVPVGAGAAPASSPARSPRMAARVKPCSAAARRISPPAAICGRGVVGVDLKTADHSGVDLVGHRGVGRHRRNQGPGREAACVNDGSGGRRAQQDDIGAFCGLVGRGGQAHVPAQAVEVGFRCRPRPHPDLGEAAHDAGVAQMSPAHRPQTDHGKPVRVGPGEQVDRERRRRSGPLGRQTSRVGQEQWLPRAGRQQQRPGRDDRLALGLREVGRYLHGVHACVSQHRLVRDHVTAIREIGHNLPGLHGATCCELLECLPHGRLDCCLGQRRTVVA